MWYLWTLDVLLQFFLLRRVESIMANMNNLNLKKELNQVEEDPSRLNIISSRPSSPTTTNVAPLNQNTSYQLNKTGKLTLASNPAKAGIAREKCMVKGGFKSRIGEILQSPQVGNVARWTRVLETVEQDCTNLMAKNPDADIGYILDIDKQILQWKKNAAAIKSPQAGGRKGKSKTKNQKKSKVNRKTKRTNRKH